MTTTYNHTFRCNGLDCKATVVEPYDGHMVPKMDAYNRGYVRAVAGGWRVRRGDGGLCPDCARKMFAYVGGDIIEEILREENAESQRLHTMSQEP